MKDENLMFDEVEEDTEQEVKEYREMLKGIKEDIDSYFGGSAYSDVEFDDY